MALSKQTFHGWVDELLPKGEYGRELIIRDCKDPTTEKWPNFITFNLSKKNIALFDNITVNSEVSIEYYLCGRKGISKRNNKPYHINSLNIAKVEVNELAVVAGASSTKEEEDAQPKPDDNDPLPF